MARHPRSAEHDPGYDFDLAEVLTDVRTVHEGLRDALPVLVAVAAEDAGWPDTLLTDVAVTVAQSVTRLEATAGLLTPDD